MNRTSNSAGSRGQGTAFDSDTFRQALGCFASGVTIVTARDGDSGRPMGLTANAFSAVSLDPPLILVCIDRQARTATAIESGGAFAVHILAEDQADTALAFAGRADDKFAGIGWHWSASGLERFPTTGCSMGGSMRDPTYLAGEGQED